MQFVRVNLERQGYTVVSASNGDDALAMTEEFEPDLLILDVDMPNTGADNLSGLEALSRIRSSPETKDIPIIALTSYADDDHIFRIWIFSPWCTLIKPFNPMELITFVRRIFKSLSEAEQDDD